MNSGWPFFTGTLKENAASNSFTFEYVTMPVETTTTTETDTRPVYQPYRPVYPVTGNRPANTNPAAPESVIEDVIENGPEAVLDMDVPLAGPEVEGQSENPGSPEGQGGSIVKTVIGLIGAGAAALLGYFIFLLFKRRDEHS